MCDAIEPAQFENGAYDGIDRAVGRPMRQGREKGMAHALPGVVIAQCEFTGPYRLQKNGVWDMSLPIAAVLLEQIMRRLAP